MTDAEPGEMVAARDLLVRPAAVEAVVENQLAYQALCQALLDPSDYQQIGDREFKKKSAWRKLNVAFNVTTELLRDEQTRDDAGRLVRATVVARATAPNGRYSDGIGVCSASERSFAHPDHDIVATAHTRATNRASADLYGMGEVSAEEVVARDLDDAYQRGQDYQAARWSPKGRPRPPGGARAPERPPDAVYDALPEANPGRPFK